MYWVKYRSSRYFVGNAYKNTEYNYYLNWNYLPNMLLYPREKYCRQFEKEEKYTTVYNFKIPQRIQSL